jgi:hypothetical protein
MKGIKATNSQAPEVESNFAPESQYRQNYLYNSVNFSGRVVAGLMGGGER